MKIPVPDDDQSDGELMFRLAKGEVRCLGILYRHHGDAVLRFLRGMLLDESDAEDLCHEVFLTVMQCAKRYEEKGQLRSWIFGIASRKARAWRRKRLVRKTLLGRYRAEHNPQVSSGSPDHLVAQRDILSRVECAIGQLSSKQREVLLLHVGEQMTGEQIARTLRINVGTVRVRLHRARAAMQQLLEQDIERTSHGAEP